MSFDDGGDDDDGGGGDDDGDDGGGDDYDVEIIVIYFLASVTKSGTKKCSHWNEILILIFQNSHSNASNVRLIIINH